MVSLDKYPRTIRKIDWNVKGLHKPGRSVQWNIRHALSVLKTRYGMSNRYDRLLTAEREANARAVQLKRRGHKSSVEFVAIRDKLKAMRIAAAKRSGSRVHYTRHY